MIEKLACDHCGKKECANCIKMDGRNFCCIRCYGKCKAQEQRNKKEGKEPVNVCKFC